MKKVISLFMAFVMLLSVTSGLTLTVYAGTTVSGTSKENISWEYNSITKTMTFSGSGILYFDTAGDYCGLPLPWQGYVEQRLFGKGKDKQAEIQYSCGFVAGWLPKS